MRTIDLSPDELHLISDALDSHIRYELSGVGIGGDGEPFGPDEEEIEACGALIAKLESATDETIRPLVEALQTAIDDQARHVAGLEDGFEAGYLDGLRRALDIVQTKAHGLVTGAERE